MNRLTRLVLAPLGVVGAMVAVGAAPVAAQEANPFEKNVLEVEAKTLYCQGGGTTCAQSSSDLTRLVFADVTVFRFSPVTASKGDGASGDDRSGDIHLQAKRVSATPELVHAVCGTHYLGKDGHVHAKSIDVTAATGNAIPVPIPPEAQGKIEGRATVWNGEETSRFAVGAIDVEASTKDSRAEIEGIQVTDNTNDTRRFGGFRIKVHGTVMDFDISNPTAPPTSLGPGTMGCRTNVTPVPITALTPPLSGFAAPPSFTSEVNDSGDPNDPS
jgi:hypothetical protein